MVIFERKDDYGFIRWSSEVKRRDHYTCVICGRKGVALNSHHLNAWAQFPDERYDVDNGACLCQDCHDRFHATYGKGKNTKDQFDEFFIIMKAMIGNVKEDAVVEYTSRRMLQEVEKDLAIKFILQDLENRDGYTYT